MTQTKNTDAKRRADELAATWIMTATNEGTYGATEACRATGSGDPEHNNFRVYTRVGDGHTRIDGCDSRVAPGYTRYINSRELSAAQAELRRLRELAGK